MNKDAGIKGLLVEIKKRGFFVDLIQQINKDFVRASVDHKFSESIEPDSLSRNLTAVLFELITWDFEKYINLLYAIDISEERIKKLPDQFVDELAGAVSFLIVEREWLKVQYRNKA